MTKGDSHQEVEAVAADLAAAGVSAVPIIGGVVAGLISAAEQRQQRRAIRLVQKALEGHALRIEQLERAVGSDDSVAELVEHVLRVGVDARTEEKLDALAAVLAGGVLGVGDGARIERSHLLLNLLSQIEGPHIAVLAVIGIPHRATGGYEGLPITGTTSEGIKLLRPDLAEVVDPVTTALQSQGLVQNVGTGREGGVGPPEQLALTDLGAWLVATLESRP